MNDIGGLVLSFCVAFCGLLYYTYDNLEYKGYPRNSSCTGQFYADYKNYYDRVEGQTQPFIQSNDFVSPVKWHLGHTTWFFENFILQKSKNYRKFDKSFNYIFNSYYNGVGIYNPKEKRGTINRPLLNHVIKYIDFLKQNPN